jgi:CheY-like chemotaxis protein
MPRVLAFQRYVDPLSTVLELLREEGFDVVTATSESDAFERVGSCMVVLLDEPPVERCPDTLCGRIRQDIRPVPPMVAVLSGANPGRRLGRCAGCMEVFSCTSRPEVIVEAIKRAAVWWPGDI